MSTVKTRNSVITAVVWIVPQIVAFAGGIAVAAWVISIVANRVDDAHGLVLTLVTAIGAWSILGVLGIDVSKTIAANCRRPKTATATADRAQTAVNRDPNLFDDAIKDRSLHMARWAIENLRTDVDHIEAARAIARWITDPMGDRRVRDRAAHHLYRRLDKKVPVAEFLTRAGEFETFLRETEEWFLRA